MKVEISGIRVAMTKETDDFIHKKIQKVSKYLKNIITSHVILKLEKDRYETEINIFTKGSVINSKEVANELYASIEGAIKKVINQSKKYTDKKKSHKAAGYKKVVQMVEASGGGGSETPLIVRVTGEVAKQMEVEEAAMQLQSSRNNFLIFLNAETNQMNVMHKRENGTFALIEPS